MTKKIGRIILIVVMIMLVIGLSLVTMSASPVYRTNQWVDTNAMFSMGRALASGMVPYRDIVEQRGPLMFGLFAIASFISKTSFIGVFVIISAGINGIWGFICRHPLTRLNLAKGMATGLEFKLGSEILRTVVVREVSEIYTVAAIIALRAALTFLIHWEIKNEEAHTEQLTEDAEEPHE